MSRIYPSNGWWIEINGVSFGGKHNILRKKNIHSLSSQYRHSESFPECEASSALPFTTEHEKVQPGMLLFIFNISHAHISGLKPRMCTRFWLSFTAPTIWVGQDPAQIQTGPFSWRLWCTRRWPSWWYRGIENPSTWVSFSASYKSMSLLYPGLSLFEFKIYFFIMYASCHSKLNDSMEVVK